MKFKLLGKKAKLPNKPSIKILEVFENQNQDALYLVPFVCQEFTTMCPVTGQPDYARFEILYSPNVKMVEAKSLKFYLYSFRNERTFHEDLTNRIFKDLWRLMDPKFMRIIGDFNVRGGIAIKPLLQKFSSDISPQDKESLLEMLKSWDAAKGHLHP